MDGQVGNGRCSFLLTWMCPTFHRGLSRDAPLLLGDLPLLPPHLSPLAVVSNFLHHGGFTALLTRTRGLSLWHTLSFFISTHAALFAGAGALFVARLVASAAVPFLIEALLQALEADGDSDIGSRAFYTRGGVLVGALAAAFLVSFAVVPQAWLIGTRLAQRTQAVLIALGAAKGALISRSARRLGEQQLLFSRYATALLDADLFSSLHANTWSPILSLMLGIWSLVRLLGAPAACAGTAVMAGLTLLAFRVRNSLKAFERASNAISSERVGLLQEALRNALPLRTILWDSWSFSRIHTVRTRELQQLWRAQLLRVAVDAIFAGTLPATVLAAFFVFAAQHGGAAPPPTAAFSAITWLTFMLPSVKGLPALTQQFVDASVFLGKLSDNCSLPEAETAHLAAWGESHGDSQPTLPHAPSASLAAVEDALLHAMAQRVGGVRKGVVPHVREAEQCVGVVPHDRARGSTGEGSSAPPLLTLRSLTILVPREGAADGEDLIPLVSDISFSVSRGSVTLLLGTTGTGKSLLLRAIVGDARCAPVPRPPMRVHARIAYVPQDPWLQRRSMRENITALGCGDEEVVREDEEWLQLVLRSCALEADIDALPLGLDTRVSDEGGSLSGGQRARLALSRAVYAFARGPPTLFVLDDIFAAVDASMGQVLWHDCIQGLLVLRGHGVLLATHALHFASSLGVTQCVVLGAPAGDVKLASGHRGLHVIAQGSYADVAHALPATSSTSSAYAATVLVAPPPPHTTASNAVCPPLAALASTTKARADNTTTDAQQTGGSLRAWRHYASAVGWRHGGALLVLYAASQAVSVAQSFWLKLWAGQEWASAPQWAWDIVGQHGEPGSPTARNTAGGDVFALLGGAFVLLSALRLTLLTISTLHASRVLHDSALQGLLGAPAATLSSRPTGEVLVRFEKDIDHIDSWVRPNILLTATAVFSLCGTLAVVGVSSPWLLLFFAPLALIYVLLGRVYTLVIMRLRSLDAASSSSVTGLWREVSQAEGAATLRAAGPDAIAASVLSILELLETQQRTKVAVTAGSLLAGSLLSATGNAVTLFAAVAGVWLVGTHRADAASVGLLLVYAYSFPSDVGALISNLGYLEQSAVSIARVAEFASFACEDTVNAPRTSVATPDVRAEVLACEAAAAAAAPVTVAAASLHVRGLGLRYRIITSPPPPVRSALLPELQRALLEGDEEEARSEDDATPWVLRGLSFDIPAGAKVAVVGRSGAGKSSLFSTILRLWPHEEGAIFVGTEDCGLLPHARDVRARIASLPQAGLLLSGSLRENLLGPLSNTHHTSWPDARIIAHCESVSPLLAARIAAAGGLDARVGSQGTSRGGTSGKAAGAATGGSSSSEWSRGERALLSVARLLLAQDLGGARARIILMDEPTSDVDVAADAALHDVLLARPETLLCIMHRRTHLHRFSHVLEISGCSAKLSSAAEYLCES